MRTLKISFLVFILSTTISAQWFPQNSGTNNNLHSVFFVNDSVGFVGDSHNIYKTINGGNLWTHIGSQDSLYIIDIFYLNENIAWYTFQSYQNYNGGVFKTTNSGMTWNLQMTTGSDVNIGRIQFVDELIMGPFFTHLMVVFP